MKIFADKLMQGDEVRVIAPSLSLKLVSQDNIANAIQTLESLDLQITFGEYVNEEDIFHSSSIQSRISDLHAAFLDKNVKAILAVKGGSNANQLLSYIDYDLIKKNPKIFCGFSDITALQNAIYHKAGLVTYSGPQFSSFAIKEELEYTIKFFKRIFFENMPIHLTCSTRWLDEESMLNHENRIFKNEGYWLIHPGEAKGTLIGGNISTFQLLHGTPYMPSFDNAILFLEADNITAPYGVSEFDRDLQSLIHQPCFKNVKALVFGRFEKSFGMNLEKLTFIINSKPELKHIPVIANADFGHTIPVFTFPVGGTCDIKAKEISNITINLVEH